MKREPLVIGGIVFLLLLVLFACFGPAIGGGYLKNGGSPYLAPGVGGHLLGTDELGRDIVARLAYGARVSLSIGLAVQFMAVTCGVAMGMVGTFALKWLRIVANRFTDSMFAFPDILLAILIIGLFNTNSIKVEGWIGQFITSGVLPVIIALGITAWPSFSRLTLTVATSLKDREFVVASRALGASPTYVILKHILPQMWGIILAVSMVELAGTILAESTLSFLGIGVLPPYPSWGAMINTARSDMESHPLALIWPCLMLSLSIFALNFVGDGLREALDPRKK